MPSLHIFIYYKKCFEQNVQSFDLKQANLFHAKGFRNDFRPSAELQLICMLEGAAHITNCLLFEEEESVLMKDLHRISKPHYK